MKKTPKKSTKLTKKQSRVIKNLIERVELEERNHTYLPEACPRGDGGGRMC